MIESSDFHDFVHKSIENKFANTTENNLQLFFAQTNNFNSSDNDFSESENSLFNISRNSKLDIFNPVLPLKKEEKTKDDLFMHYFYNKKENKSNIVDYAKKRKIFNVIQIKKFDMFNNKENASLSNENILRKNKVFPTIKRRRENQDNIRKKLKTAFFNKFLYKKINQILKNKQSKLYFTKFPISFVNDIRKNNNKNIINKTLLEIMLNKELYNEKDLNNYHCNLKVLENKETKEIQELKEILNKKFCELFDEYINSKEFNIDEIKRLKNNNMDNIYIERYIYQSKHFIEYFADKQDFK